MIPLSLPSWRTVRLLLGGLALAFLGFQLLIAKTDARHWKKQAEQQTGLRLQDQERWKDAAAKATYDAVLNVYRTTADQAAISERTVHALTLDRDTARGAYQRLQQGAAAHLGAPIRADLSEEREATCRAVAGTSCDQIPALLKAAQDNTDQLLRWIEWGKAQGEVETVPTPDQLEGAQ